MENILFKVPEPSEYSKVLEAFEKYFIKHEPGLTSLGGYPDGLPPKILERYRRFLEEGVSVIAIDKTNDLICGTMVSVMLTRENESMTSKPTFEDLTGKSLSEALILGSTNPQVGKKCSLIYQFST